jgi:hypothetical protein
MPADVARCHGYPPPRTDTMTNMLKDGGYKYLQRTFCKRRLPPPIGDHQVWMEPPEFIKGKCPNRI